MASPSTKTRVKVFYFIDVQVSYEDDEGVLQIYKVPLILSVHKNNA